ADTRYPTRRIEERALFICEVDALRLDEPRQRIRRVDDIRRNRDATVPELGVVVDLVIVLKPADLHRVAAAVGDLLDAPPVANIRDVGAVAVRLRRVANVDAFEVGRGWIRRNG